MDLHRKNLSGLFILRNIALLGQLLAVGISYYYLILPLSYFPLILTVIGIGVVNTLTFFRLKSQALISEKEIFWQILFDVFSLFLLLLFAGGAHNPFTSLFILQVVIAATILSPKYTWGTTAMATILYSVLNLYSPETHLHHHPQFMNLHYQGMLLSFFILAVLVSYFVVKMAVVIRKQHVQLKEIEQMAILGTFVTGAAHELGTPLSTISILASDLMESGEDDEKNKKAKLLKNQVLRCKEILSSITVRAGVIRAESGKPILGGEFIQEILETSTQKFPETEFEITSNHLGLNEKILSDGALRQSLLNIINNSVEASPDWVGIDINCTPNQWNFSFKDKGPGIPENVIHSIMPGMTTKKDGMGLGLYLTQAVVDRLGGELILTNYASGARVGVSIPLESMRII